MRSIVKLGIITVVCCLLISCGKVAVDVKPQQNGVVSPGPNQQNEKKEIVQIKSSGTFGYYDMSGQFLDKVNSNPIDHDHDFELKALNQSKDFSTLALIEFESKYTKIWDTELNSIYKKLQAKLNQNEKDMLIESQKGWLQYHTKEAELVNQVFYLRESGPILGSQGAVQMQQAFEGRLRERTLELMEYYWILGNNVEFAYKGKND